MGKTIAVHSFKGGTGKTLVATNLAASLAKAGHSVCLLDLDFRAPSLQLVFAAKPERWLNEYLYGDAEPDAVLVDVKDRYGLKPRFLVSPTDPSIRAIQDIITKDRKKEMRALQRLLSLRDALFNRHGVDYIVADTSPGVQYSSLNAIILSDVTMLVSINDEADLDGTLHMLREVYEAFEKKSCLLLNRTLCEAEFTGQKEKLVGEIEGRMGIPVLDALPLFCDLLHQKRTAIISLEEKNHPFALSLARISERLGKL